MGYDTQEVCSNCGAPDGLHQWSTNKCPKNGIEETRDGKKQEWEETVFEGYSVKRLHDNAYEMLDILKEFLAWANIQDGSPSQHLRDKAIEVIKKATE